ncbi:BF3164 family lipoprotein [candidate division KSB1 bacterium]
MTRSISASKIVLLIVLLSSIFCTNEPRPIAEIESNPEILKYKILVKFEESPSEGSLNKPFLVRKNEANDTYVICDEGDRCLYVYDKNGRFIRQIGQQGQGPGEFSRPNYFTIDESGNIFVLDTRNSRITVFKPDGTFDYSFNLGSRQGFNRYIISENNEMIVSKDSEYYFSIYDTDGELLREFGEMVRDNEDDNANRAYTEGFPIVNKKGEYVIFLQHLPFVRIYDPDGNLIEQKNVQEQMGIKEYKALKDIRSSPMGMEMTDYYLNVVYRDNKYWCIRNSWENETVRIDVRILNEDFRLIEMKSFDFSEYEGGLKSADLRIVPEVLDSGEILFPMRNSAEILIFK